MVRVEDSIVVERPIDDVFAYMTDPETLPEWQGSCLEARLEGSEPMHAGSRVRETRKFLGRRIESTMEVAEHEPPRRFVIRVGSGPVPFTASNSLSEANGGTRIDATVEGEPGGFFRLAEPLVVRALEREMKNNLATLKDVLEARA